MSFPNHSPVYSTFNFTTPIFASMIDRRLPVELIDMVFAHMYGTVECSSSGTYKAEDTRHSKADLSSCALACRSFRELARPYLFRELSFSFRRSVLGLEVEIERRPSDENDNEVKISDGSDDFLEYAAKSKSLRDLLPFLTGNVHISQCVRNLTLRMRPEYPPGGLYGPLAFGPRLFELSALLGSAVLPSLHRLELHDVLPDELLLRYYKEENPETTYRAIIPHLDRLYIHQSPHTSYDHEYWPAPSTNLLLNMFSSINELYFVDVRIKTSRSVGDFGSCSVLPPHVQVKTLSLNDVYPISMFLHGLECKHGPDLKQITSLELVGSCYRGEDLLPFFSLVEAHTFDSNLTRLAFSIDSSIIVYTDLEKLDLAKCVKLEMLTLRLQVQRVETTDEESEYFRFREDDSEGYNEIGLSFMARTLATCFGLTTLTRVALVFDLRQMEPKAGLEFPHDSPEFRAVENELLALFDATPLKEIVIAPQPHQFCIDCTTPLYSYGMHRHTWQVSQFPLQVFPKIRAAGKLNVMGEIPDDIKMDL